MIVVFTVNSITVIVRCNPEMIVNLVNVIESCKNMNVAQIVTNKSKFQNNECFMKLHEFSDL